MSIDSWVIDLGIYITLLTLGMALLALAVAASISLNRPERYALAAKFNVAAGVLLVVALVMVLKYWGLGTGLSAVVFGVIILSVIILAMNIPDIRADRRRAEVAKTPPSN